MYDGSIYETTCLPNGMKYRGRHTRLSDPENRDDREYLGSPTNPQFWEDLEKYGRDAFVRVILDEGPFEDRLSWMKQETRRLKEVDAANNPQYYNRSNWGGTRDQYGENNPMYGKRGILHPNYGKPGPTKGKHHSEDTKEKISISNRGILPSIETREKMSRSHAGKPLTEYHKKRLSETSAHLSGEKNGMYGRHHTEIARMMIGNAQKGDLNHFYGKHHSEETRKKISDKLRVENLSEDRRRALSERAKNRRYELVCQSCGGKFIGKSWNKKYCINCEEVLN